MKNVKLAGTILLASVSAAVCFGQANPAPASVVGKVAGTSTLNEAKSKVQGPPLIFRTSADGGLEEVRGSDVAPIVEPVHLDGKPYDIDGGATTLAWKQPGPNQFERTSSTKGQVVNTRHITISDGGKTLTQVTEGKLTDGTTSLVTIVYGRNSGDGSGLAGVWNAQSRHTNSPRQFTLSATGPNSLKLISRAGLTYTVTLDNKPVPVTGPGVISGVMTAMKQADGRTIASTDSRNGTVTANSTWKLSSDGKVLTVTDRQVGPNASKEPSVEIYDKQ
jgi:hypothetical protein